MKCAFCNAHAPDVEAAIDAGWLPGYWIGSEEISDPVCAACVRDRLQESPEDGEMELRPLADAPIIVNPSSED